MHRYLQLPELDVKDYEEKYQLIRQCGIKYFDADKKLGMYEFHVDTCEIVMEKMNNESKYGGNLSVLFRKIKVSKDDCKVLREDGVLPIDAGIEVGDYIYYDGNLCNDAIKQHYGIMGNGGKIWEQKALTLLGHYECIFKQYLFAVKAWKDIQGKITIIPKDEGAGQMVSAFQSRKLGFSHTKLSGEERKKINDFRRGKKFLDLESARIVLGLEYKKDLL